MSWFIAAMRRVASSPPIPGMERSITTTSGSESLRHRHPLLARPRLPHHLQARLGLEEGPQARAQHGMVVDEQDADHVVLHESAGRRFTHEGLAWRPSADRP